MSSPIGSNSRREDVMMEPVGTTSKNEKEYIKICVCTLSLSLSLSLFSRRFISFCISKAVDSIHVVFSLLRRIAVNKLLYQRTNLQCLCICHLFTFSHEEVTVGVLLEHKVLVAHTHRPVRTAGGKNCLFGVVALQITVICRVVQTSTWCRNITGCISWYFV